MLPLAGQNASSVMYHTSSSTSLKHAFVGMHDPEDVPTNVFLTEVEEDVRYRTELATIAGGHPIVDITAQELRPLAGPCVAKPRSLC